MAGVESESPELEIEFRSQMSERATFIFDDGSRYGMLLLEESKIDTLKTTVVRGARRAAVRYCWVFALQRESGKSQRMERFAMEMDFTRLVTNRTRESGETTPCMGKVR